MKLQINKSVAMLIASAMIFSIVIVAKTFSSSQEVITEPITFIQIDTQTAIDRLQAKLKDQAGSADEYAQLGTLLLQRVRETADPSLYSRAEQAFEQALGLDANQLDALIGQGSLALMRHQFAQAIVWGNKALAINPYRAQIYGVIGDAQIELGLYDEAVKTIQKMVDTRPDLASYSRVSYVRELHGDTVGAIDAMKRALAASNPNSEAGLWTQVVLGNLYFNSGDLKQAEETYRAALWRKQDYLQATAGIAKVRAAEGKFDEAIELYQQVITALPLPEHAIALGDLYTHIGKQKEADAQYDLVRVIQKLNADAGTDVDMELALFDADHGKGQQDSELRARDVYARRPSIYGADALAWTLYHNGKYDEAKAFIDKALSLGTRDAMFHFHAGKIEWALKNELGARKHFEQALDINPHFSLIYAKEARAHLDKRTAQANEGVR
jgi:tetratricopeptide (TPR) repeat protein